MFDLSPGRVGRARRREGRPRRGAGDQIIWPHLDGEGYGSPKSVGAATSMTVLIVDDVNAHCERALTAGDTQIIEEPIDHPYGVRE